MKLGSTGAWMGTEVMQQGNGEGQHRRGREREELEEGPVGPARSRGQGAVGARMSHTCSCSESMEICQQPLRL